MFYLKKVLLVGSAGILLLQLTTLPVDAVPTLNYWNVASGNWNVPGNWSGNSLPDGGTDDFAVIGGTSGASGISIATSTINSAIANMPGGIQLGLAGSNSGTLQISSGGSITVADTTFDGDGSVTVGVAGTGTLNIDRGGSLIAVSLTSSGTTSSLIRLGTTTGSGSAVVNVGDANLARTTRVVGPNVDFTAANLNLTGGTLIEQITSSTHSALKATSLLTLGGTLSFQFDSSITPTLGNTWDLINARQTVSAFSTVSLSGAPPLPVGQVYNVRTQPSVINVNSVNVPSTLTQLAVEQRLVLNVDRATHVASIANPGAAGISIDGYTVHSATLNELIPGNFTPLSGTWQVANSATDRVSQLNPTAVPTFGTGSSTSIGNIFAPPTPANFGDATEDLTFEYTQPGSSTTLTGVVNYIGSTGVNNLVLRVDPANGAAQLKNTSQFTASIDGYTISSNLASLDTAQWSSLDDQNAAGGDWQEADISASRLSELKYAGVTSLPGGQSYNIGNPFNEVLGQRDLVFQYLLQGESIPRTGVVVYETIPATLPGDYDGNGIVNAADYVLWRKSPGSFGGAGGYTTWRNNFGSAGSGSGSSTLGGQAVPEPASSTMVVIGLGLMFASVLSRRSMRSEYATRLAVRV